MIMLAIGLMLLAIAYIMQIVFIGFEINDLKRKLTRFYVDINNLFSKLNGLYKGDKHGTLRPKIDILDDDILMDIRSIATDIYELQKKMEKLEKKK